MKFKLMIQSLSPLALLTIVRNFKFVTVNENGERLKRIDFIGNNIVLLTVMLFCAVCVLMSLAFYLEFKAFKWAGTTGGYEITGVQDNEEASLNFFLTIIIPLLIDEVDTIQGALTFFLIIGMMAVLLYKTKLFYANPVLAILGYHFYEFRFKSNEHETGKYICVAGSKLHDSSVIIYKKITDQVFYAKESM